MDFSISSSPVLLRPLEPEDLELLYTIENDATLWDVCDDTTPYSRYALRQYIANQPQDLHQCRELRLIIVERQTVAPIGIVDLVNYSPKNQRAEISIALLRHKRGKGYGEKAIFCWKNMCNVSTASECFMPWSLLEITRWQTVCLSP